MLASASHSVTTQNTGSLLPNNENPIYLGLMKTQNSRRSESTTKKIVKVVVYLLGVPIAILSNVGYIYPARKFATSILKLPAGETFIAAIALLMHTNNSLMSYSCAAKKVFTEKSLSTLASEKQNGKLRLYLGRILVGCATPLLFMFYVGPEAVYIFTAHEELGIEKAITQAVISIVSSGSSPIFSATELSKVTQQHPKDHIASCTNDPEAAQQYRVLLRVLNELLYAVTTKHNSTFYQEILELFLNKESYNTNELLKNICKIVLNSRRHSPSRARSPANSCRRIATIFAVSSIALCRAAMYGIVGYTAIERILEGDGDDNSTMRLSQNDTTSATSTSVGSPVLPAIGATLLFAGMLPLTIKLGQDAVKGGRSLCAHIQQRYTHKKITGDKQESMAAQLYPRAHALALGVGALFVVVSGTPHWIISQKYVDQLFLQIIWYTTDVAVTFGAFLHNLEEVLTYLPNSPVALLISNNAPADQQRLSLLQWIQSMQIILSHCSAKTIRAFFSDLEQDVISDLFLLTQEPIRTQEQASQA